MSSKSDTYGKPSGSSESVNPSTPRLTTHGKDQAVCFNRSLPAHLAPKLSADS
jgi:hypothetical protein